MTLCRHIMWKPLLYKWERAILSILVTSRSKFLAETFGELGITYYAKLFCSYFEGTLFLCKRVEEKFIRRKVQSFKLISWKTLLCYIFALTEWNLIKLFPVRFILPKAKTDQHHVPGNQEGFCDPLNWILDMWLGGWSTRMYSNPSAPLGNSLGCDTPYGSATVDMFDGAAPTTSYKGWRSNKNSKQRFSIMKNNNCWMSVFDTFIAPWRLFFAYRLLFLRFPLDLCTY